MLSRRGSCLELDAARTAAWYLCLGITGIGAARSSAGQDSEVRMWTVPAAPILRFGGDAQGRTDLRAVVRMPSGEFVAANPPTYELWRFGPTGTFLQSLGGRGDRPGEFESPFLRLARVDNRLFVIESPPGPSRVHVFAFPGGFQTRFVFPPSEGRGRVSAIARLSTGQYLVNTAGFRALTDIKVGSVIQDSISLGLLTIGKRGHFVKLGTFPSKMWIAYEAASRPGQVALAHFSFGASLAIGASGDRVWLGNSGTGEITILDSAGRTMAAVILQKRLRPFSKAKLDVAKRRALAEAATNEERAQVEAIYAQVRLPSTAPAFTRLVPGTDGEMWVELFDEDVSTPTRFMVLDRAGRTIANVVLPARLRVDDIGRDYVLGVETNEQRLDHVVLYRLTRP